MATQDAHAHAGAPSRFSRNSLEGVKEAAGKAGHAIQDVLGPFPRHEAIVQAAPMDHTAQPEAHAHQKRVDHVKEKETASRHRRKSVEIAKKVGHFVAEAVTPLKRDEVWEISVPQEKKQTH